MSRRLAVLQFCEPPLARHPFKENDESSWTLQARHVLAIAATAMAAGPWHIAAASAPPTQSTAPTAKADARALFRATQARASTDRRLAYKIASRPK